MICPHCKHQFALTWNRYLKSPLGKHRCPACGRSSRFKITFGYVGLVLLAWLLFFGVAFAFTAWFLRTYPGPLAMVIVLATYLAASVAIAALDKFYDERFRKLE